MKISNCFYVLFCCLISLAVTNNSDKNTINNNFYDRPLETCKEYFDKFESRYDSTKKLIEAATNNSEFIQPHFVFGRLCDGYRYLQPEGCYSRKENLRIEHFTKIKELAVMAENKAIALNLFKDSTHIVLSLIELEANRLIKEAKQDNSLNGYLNTLIDIKEFKIKHYYRWTLDSLYWQVCTMNDTVELKIINYFDHKIAETRTESSFLILQKQYSYLSPFIDAWMLNTEQIKTVIKRKIEALELQIPFQTKPYNENCKSITAGYYVEELQLKNKKQSKELLQLYSKQESYKLSNDTANYNKINTALINLLDKSAIKANRDSIGSVTINLCKYQRVQDTLHTFRGVKTAQIMYFNNFLAMEEAANTQVQEIDNEVKSGFVSFIKTYNRATEEEYQPCKVEFSIQDNKKEAAFISPMQDVVLEVKIDKNKFAVVKILRINQAHNNLLQELKK